MPELSQIRPPTQDHLWEGPQEVAGPLPIHCLLLPLLLFCPCLLPTWEGPAGLGAA